MTHIVCFSGGEGSALAAIEVYRRFGAASLVLLNHDIHPNVEDSDIKQFKQAVADYCDTPVTFANMVGWDTKDQFDVVVEAGAFKVRNGTALCSNRMKTAPFDRWLEANVTPADCIVYYGFGNEPSELKRVTRRSSIMGGRGFATDYPLLWPNRTIKTISEIGLTPPGAYGLFTHANCKGCLKAGMQHWYVIYCTRPDIFERGKWAEDEIGYSIINGYYLADLEPKFAEMKRLGIPATEHIPFAKFWAASKAILKDDAMGQDRLFMPCECTI